MAAVVCNDIDNRYVDIKFPFIFRSRHYRESVDYYVGIKFYYYIPKGAVPEPSINLYKLCL